MASEDPIPVDVTAKQVEYFSALHRQHSGTPMAVSSESQAHKQLRYERIVKFLEDDRSFTLHDVGMGLGDFYSYLRGRLSDRNITYSGTEVVPSYCDHCRTQYPEIKVHQRDLSEAPPEERYDYLLLSGVFHQMRDVRRKDWETYMQALLVNCFHACRKAVIFNAVSPFVDFYQASVYYCNLLKVLEFVNDRLSRFFVLDHAYALFEFTIVVYRHEFVRERFREPEFAKYFRHCG